MGSTNHYFHHNFNLPRILYERNGYHPGVVSVLGCGAMSAEPLKPVPCPWCDKQPQIMRHMNRETMQYEIAVGCPEHTRWFVRESEADAIAAWNRRAVEPFGNPEELPLWMKEIITEKLMPGSRPWNYETRVIMDTLEWVLSLNKPEKE